MNHSIVGFGVSGMILFLELMKSKTDCSTICIFDPNWLGGDLVVKYGNVLSNTPWSKTRNVLSQYDFASSGINYGDSKYTMDDLMPVSDMAICLMIVCTPFLKKVKQVTGFVKEILQLESCWQISVNETTMLSKNVYLCSGSDSKVIDLEIPNIPLEIALDLERLRHFVIAGEHVAVFGCSHSGLIIMKNLHTVGAIINGIYRGEKPFYYSRDGVYNGIKGDIVEFADNVNSIESIKLNCWNDPLKIHKILSKCDKIVVATGFKRRSFDLLGLGGTKIDGNNYDYKTGIIDNKKGLYGCGIAYPGITTVDNIAYDDVGLQFFQQQIQTIMLTSE